ncbi:hypothetical protein [Hydrocoleum sp. CS-953]|nr:hypothetical protein [Hydrocoleum sp. CS-953]
MKQLLILADRLFRQDGINYRKNFPGQFIRFGIAKNTPQLSR